MNYSKGPWTVSALVNTNNGEIFTKITNGCDVIAEFKQRAVGRTFPELIANAHLIAAAPELLEALQNYINHPFDEEGVNQKAVARCLAAIAKAQGEPSSPPPEDEIPAHMMRWEEEMP